MQETILIIYLVVSIALIGIILLQQGKGAEMGASFGAGGANTVFGAAGSGNVLTKSTTVLAILFFAIALSISYLNSEPSVVTDSVLDEETAIENSTVAPSLDTELPAAEDSLESQVAPLEKEVAVEADTLAEELGEAASEAEKAVEEKTQDEQDSTDK